VLLVTYPRAAIIALKAEALLRMTDQQVLRCCCTKGGSPGAVGAMMLRTRSAMVPWLPTVLAGRLSL
jgi:hypothetical protein